MDINISKYQIITIVWIILIFGFSSQPAKDSNKLSMGTTKDIAKIIEIKNIKNENILENFNHKIRKSAHFFNYTILGILMTLNFKNKKNKNIFFSLLFCVLIASIDEFYQKFIPGRTSKITDVFIDSSGSIFGLILLNIFYKIKNKIIFI